MIQHNLFEEFYLCVFCDNHSRLSKRNHNSDGGQSLREYKKVHKENKPLIIMIDSSAARNETRELIKTQKKIYLLVYLKEGIQGGLL
jgi:site-specific DNA-adenine methylase